MTGITRDELMQMAREAGMPFKALPDDYCDDMGLVRGVICIVDNVRFSCVEAFFNAILERAAVAVEPVDSGGHEIDPYDLGHVHAAQHIRALKINTGD